MHVGVNATGVLEETRRFYEEILGLRPLSRPAIPQIPGYWFRAGDSQLHLVGTRDKPAEVGPKGHHFCLAVDDIETATAWLTASRVPWVERGSLDVRQIWLADPAGGAVELQQQDGQAMKLMR
jgi:catechol 2,3-dioxygenase-like lactoylglutathione lyase family enzyme